jgi:hypothetical protein
LNMRRVCAQYRRASLLFLSSPTYLFDVRTLRSELGDIRTRAVNTQDDAAHRVVLIQRLHNRTNLIPHGTVDRIALLRAVRGDSDDTARVVAAEKQRAPTPSIIALAAATPARAQRTAMLAASALLGLACVIECADNRSGGGGRPAAATTAAAAAAAADADGGTAFDSTAKLPTVAATAKSRTLSSLRRAAL